MPAAVGRPGGPPNIGRSSDKQHAGAVFSTMDQTYPKFEQASGGVGGSSAFPLQTDRWSGYEEIDVPEMERGWMPRQRTGFETQRRARQKKNQHDVVVGSKWLSDGASEPRNRIGPLKPHTVMVTARKKEPTPIEPRFGEPTDDQWGEEVHYKDGSGSGMVEVISRTANLDYGSFTLPQKSRKGASTGLLVPVPQSEWGPHRAASVPPNFAVGRYGPPAAAKKRNQSNIKLAALPFQHPRDVYDTARWVGKDWVHPRDPDDPLFHTASWHNPKTMAHVPNTEYETTTEALSGWVAPEKNWKPGKPTEFRRVFKNKYKRAQQRTERDDTARAPSPLYSVASSAGSIQYAPRVPTAPDNFRNTRSGLLKSQSQSWAAE